MEMAIYHTGGVFYYLPHHLDLALEDSVGHSTCMSVLARRRAIMGLGLGLGLGYHGVVGGFLACCHGRWGGWWVLGGGVRMVICSTGVYNRHRVSPEFIRSRNCVPMAFTAESPPAQGQ